MFTYQNITRTSAFLAIVLLSGCSYLPSWAGGQKEEKAKVAAASGFQSENPSTQEIVPGSKSSSIPDVDSKSTKVELIWQMPQDPVDGYLISYGYGKETLDFKLKISADKLEKYQDPKNGFVYRYVLKDVSNTKNLFVAINAYKDNQVSSLSQIMEIPVNKK